MLPVDDDDHSRAKTKAPPRGFKRCSAVKRCTSSGVLCGSKNHSGHLHQKEACLRRKFAITSLGEVVMPREAPFPKKGMRFQNWSSADTGRVIRVSRKRDAVRLAWDHFEPGEKPYKSWWPIDDWQSRVNVL